MPISGMDLERQRDLATGATLETRHGYDAEGRLLWTDGPLPGDADKIHFRYDLFGRRTWEIGAADASGVRTATRTAYRVSDDKPLYAETGTIPAADSAVLTVLRRTDFAYDARRNPSQEIVAADGVTYSFVERSFDQRNRLTCEARRMDPASYAALSAAADDACIQTAAGLDRITRTVYDEASQRRQLRVGVGTGVEAADATWAYNANGQVTIVIDGNGNLAELHYDGHMRQDRWTFPSTTRPAAYDDTNPTTALASAGAVNPNDYEEYGYDEVGNRTRLRRRDNWPQTYGDILYQYDNLNRLIRKTVPERPAPHPQPLAADQTRDVFYGYDLRNLQTFARFDSASGEGITNIYDGFGRLGSTIVNLGGVSRELRFQYREDGARTRIRHPDGAGFGWNYDARGQLSDVRVEPEVLNWPLATVARDPFGRPSVLTRGAGVALTSYHYYPTDWPWIVGHNLAGGAANDLTLSFSYNRAGQISQASRDNVTDAYAWPGHANIHLEGAADGLNRIASSGFGYDANGNLVADPGGWGPGHAAHSYSYDVENRLVGASGGVTLRYDPARAALAARRTLGDHELPLRRRRPDPRIRFLRRCASPLRPRPGRGRAAGPI